MSCQFRAQIKDEKRERRGWGGEMESWDRTTAEAAARQDQERVSSEILMRA